MGEIAVGALVLLIIVGIGIVVEVSNASNRRKLNQVLDEAPLRGDELLKSLDKISSESDRLHTELEASLKRSSELVDQLVRDEITVEEFDKMSAELDLTRAGLIGAMSTNVNELISQPAPEIGASSRASQMLGEDGPRFEATYKYLARDGHAGIAIDRVQRKIALLTTYSKEIVDYSQVVSSEVCIDAETMLQTDRVGQIGGAALGGLLAGGVGALVMAMGAKKKQIDNVKQVELKILTTRTRKPAHVIRFFGVGLGGSAKAAVEEASKWHDLVSVAIREAQDDYQIEAPQASRADASSLAGEIGKLAELREQGILTENEFQRSKAKLI